MKNSTHRDGTEFKSTGRRNLENGLPAKTKAIKLGDLRQIGGIGPERIPRGTIGQKGTAKVQSQEKG